MKRHAKKKHTTKNLEGTAIRLKSVGFGDGSRNRSTPPVGLSARHSVYRTSGTRNSVRCAFG